MKSNGQYHCQHGVRRSRPSDTVGVARRGVKAFRFGRVKWGARVRVCMSQVQMTVYIDPDRKQELERAANEANESLSEYCRRMLRAGERVDGGDNDPN